MGGETDGHDLLGGRGSRQQRVCLREGSVAVARYFDTCLVTPLAPAPLQTNPSLPPSQPDQPTMLRRQLSTPSLRVLLPAAPAPPMPALPLALRASRGLASTTLIGNAGRENWAMRTVKDIKGALGKRGLPQ